jgi:predicted transcriptional regulator
MTKHRSRTDITSEILKSATGRQASKTRILHSAFLSHAQLKDYLPILTENGLLEYQTESNTYKTAEKGIKFLEMYEKMNAIVPWTRLPEVKL